VLLGETSSAGTAATRASARLPTAATNRPATQAPTAISTAFKGSPTASHSADGLKRFADCGDALAQVGRWIKQILNNAF
jgi:hypothetical protein